MRGLGKWFRDLSAGSKVAVIVAGIVGTGVFAAAGHPNEPAAVPNQSGTAQNDNTSSLTAPKTITELITTTDVIPFQQKTQSDPTLAKGITKVVTAGVNGVKTSTYKVTKTDGVEASRELVKEEITTPAVDEVTGVGTYVAPAPQQASNCDSNYSGACVPIASDVDCGGGSGNGPAFVYGVVKVIGTDIYGLDRDGDGYGCE